MGTRQQVSDGERSFGHPQAKRSRYRRFFTGMRTLSDGMLRVLTEVDHIDQKALVASPSEDSPTIIGVARFVRFGQDRAVADLAITLADDWHGRGVATGLLRLLSRRG